MKIALVRKDSKKVTLVMSQEEAAPLMASTPYQQAYFTIEVPASLETKSIQELQTSLVPVVAESWSQYEMMDVTIQPVFQQKTWVSNDETIFTTTDPMKPVGSPFAIYNQGDPDFRWSQNAAIPESWSQYEHADVYTKPTFTKKTWVSNDKTIFTNVNPKDATYKAYTKGSFDFRWTHNPAIPESWSQYEMGDVFTLPTFLQKTWVSADMSIVTTLDPMSPIGAPFTKYEKGSFDFRWTHNPEIPEHYIVVEDLVQVKLQKIMELKGIARQEILAEMLVVFGSSDMNTNQANYSTWEKMAAKPLDYASAGLSAQVDIYNAAGTTITLAKGASLQTKTKVSTYAKYRVGKAEKYSIWRLQRYEQLIADIAALG